jgi:Cu2+-exporting ATPase
VIPDIKIYPGQGLEGEISGKAYRIGTLDFVRSLSAGGDSAIPSNTDGKPLPETAEECIVLGDGSGLIAMFQLADVLRPHAVETIKQVRNAGIRVHMISGDSAPEVKRIADACGISLWQGRALPGDKQSYLSKLKGAGKLVVMIGDGVNDAPVLAAADASLAMGTGASLSQLSADAVILGGRFDSIAAAVGVSRKTMHIIRENLVWSFLYNLLVLPPAIAGWLSPWMAGIGMSLSSVLVVLNALRIARRDSLNSHSLRPDIRRVTA